MFLTRNSLYWIFAIMFLKALVKNNCFLSLKKIVWAIVMAICPFYEWSKLQFLQKWPCPPAHYPVTHKEDRDEKSLQNSTHKMLNLKKKHTKCVQKMFKIVQKWAKMPTIAKKGKKKLYKIAWQTQKLAHLSKISTRSAAAAATFFHLWKKVKDISQIPNNLTLILS